MPVDFDPSTSTPEPPTSGSVAFDPSTAAPDQPSSQPAQGGAGSRSWETRMMPSRERAIYGGLQGIAGMGVGIGQRVLPQSVQESAPFQAVRHWATDPTGDVAQSGGRVVGPAFVPIAKGAGAVASALPFASRWMPPLSNLAAQWQRTAAALTGGVIGGTTTPTDTTSPGEAWRQSGWPAVTGAGLSGALASIGRSPVAQAFQRYGVRQTPAQMVPFVGPAVESAASHVPGAKEAIGMGLRTTRDDAQHAFYRYALAPMSRNIPGISNTAAPTEVGQKGLDQLRTSIGNRMNSILQQAEFRVTPNFVGAVRQIQNDLRSSGSTDEIRNFQATVKELLTGRMPRNNNVLTGSQIAGPSGVRSQLRERADQLLKNPNKQALGRAVKRLANAFDDVTNFGGAQGANSPYGRAMRQEFLNTSESYARFKTLEGAAGRGTLREGFVDPESIDAELRGTSGYARGAAYGGNWQQMIQTMHKGGVPQVGKGGQVVSGYGIPEILAGLGVGGYAVHDPATAAKLGLSVGIPTAILNSPAGMSMLQWLASRAPSTIGAAAGGIPGRAMNEMGNQ
jgi:hypothetical protein